MTDDRFGGAWLVTEYVHDPDGRFAGIVRQRRTLEAVSPDRMRVTQVCEPDAELADHPMGAFAGRWVFELVKHRSGLGGGGGGTLQTAGPAPDHEEDSAGGMRTYVGPDVVGYGIEWSPGAVTSQGFWPRFGHSFESWAVLTAPERQLTGGFFAAAGREVAAIVGVAVPDGGEWPALDLAAEPPDPTVGSEPQRRVGPLAVAERWPSPVEQLRTLALADPQTAQSVIITDRRGHQTRRVDMSVTPWP